MARQAIACPPLPVGTEVPAPGVVGCPARPAAVRSDRIDGSCWCVAALLVVANVPRFAVAIEEQLTHFLQVERSRAAAAENSDLAAGLVSLEAIKSLSGVLAPSAVGKIIVFNLLDLTSTKHVVLRKPWCPACFKMMAAGGATKMAAAASSTDVGESA